MTRIVTVAGAQLGPVQLADDRAAVGERMIVLLQDAASQGSDLVVFPELALTTFFPRWFVAAIAPPDHFYERTLPNAATRCRRPSAQSSGRGPTVCGAGATTGRRSSRNGAGPATPRSSSDLGH